MIQTILNHRSIRKYSEKKIDKQILDEILLAGTRASTTGNMQIYSIIVSMEKELKNRLWEVHFKQDMVNQAPIVLTFCADMNRFNKWCKARNTAPAYDNFLWFYNASIDAILAAQNVALAAESHGLGICYLGTTTYMADKIADILNLPEQVVPVTTLVVGYPDESPELTDRLPVEAVVHYEKYQDYDKEKIEQLYKEKENLPSSKELIKVNGTENLAQIFTQKRYVKKDNLHFSKSFLEFIKKQNFMNND